MKRKICFVISSLSHGGSERVLSGLINFWAQKDIFDLHLVLIGDLTNQFFKISQNVKIIELKTTTPSNNMIIGFFKNVQRILALRKTLNLIQPDSVVSFLFNTNILCIFASFFQSWNLIISERNHPHFNRQSLFWNILRLMTYRLADVLVVQTDDIKDLMKNYNKNIVTIANPFFEFSNSKNNLMKKSDYTSINKILAIGSFSKQKRFDLIINAMPIILKENANACLTIFGKGSLRNYYENSIKELGLTNNIFLPGVTTDVLNAFQNHDIFVICSDYEGFPNVLLEAMGFGMPCVSMDYPTCPRGLIVDKVNGVLVYTRTSEKLASAIIQLMQDNSLRKNIGNMAKEVSNTFSIEKITLKWEGILNK
jgi:GalNAc-alpha-(1->4)-GalNAc-alpha-(1->3)-diNAcBac-PP-undecaprenol alpha-1,4-N-acetyl-D-galactosaminyltransferase